MDLLGPKFIKSDFTDKIYDLALLWVTRDLWITKNGVQKDIIGLAGTGGVCTENSKFNLLEDNANSFATYKTVCAHEIGHSLGAAHDSLNSEFIMAENDSDSDKWSSTSLNDINNFYPNTDCLCSTYFVDFEASNFYCTTVSFGGIISRGFMVKNTGNIASAETKIGVFLSDDINISDYNGLR